MIPCVAEKSATEMPVVIEHSVWGFILSEPAWFICNQTGFHQGLVSDSGLYLETAHQFSHGT